MTELPAITLWQPYASLVAAKVKTEETRPVKPPDKYVGERIAIHAAKRKMRDSELTPELRLAASNIFRYQATTLTWHDVPYGAVVATAVITRAFKIVGHAGGIGGRMAHARPVFGGEAPAVYLNAYGDFDIGRWVWQLRDIEPVDPPVPATGKQGWWKVELP